MTRHLHICVHIAESMMCDGGKKAFMMGDVLDLFVQTNYDSNTMISVGINGLQALPVNAMPVL